MIFNITRNPIAAYFSRQKTRQKAEETSVMTLAQINHLPEEEKQRIYAQLIPPLMLTHYNIDPETLCNEEGESVFSCYCPSRTSAVRLELRHTPDANDPLFLLEMQDTPFGDIEILFLNMNDPEAERFDIDRDDAGHDTALATISRNVPEELRAFRAGLAPAQVRRGLPRFRSFWKQMLQFARKFGMKQIKAVPLEYHNAIMYKFYGFCYLTERKTMERIEQEFAPGGELFNRLDGSTPFRQPALAKSIRGRSWAIHGGVLGEPWQCPRMYYPVPAAA